MCQKFDKKCIWRKALFNLSHKTHFSADSGYPKIRFRAPNPSLVSRIDSSSTTYLASTIHNFFYLNSFNLVMCVWNTTLILGPNATNFKNCGTKYCLFKTFKKSCWKSCVAASTIVSPILTLPDMCHNGLIHEWIYNDDVVLPFMT